MTECIYTTGEYLSRNPHWHAEDSAWKGAQIVRMLDRHRLAPRTVCEVGCGAGEILRQLQQKLPADCDFTGYEVSPQAFALAETRKNDRLTFRLGNIADEDRRFDLLLVMDVIEHLENYHAFLRGLRPKGTKLIAHIPLDMNANHLLRVKPLTDIRRAVGHIHFFTKETALDALRDSGFTVIDHFYTPWSLDFPPRSWRRRLGLLPRKLLFRLDPDLAVRLLGGFSLLVFAEPTPAK